MTLRSNHISRASNLLERLKSCFHTISQTMVALHYTYFIFRRIVSRFSNQVCVPSFKKYKYKNKNPLLQGGTQFSCYCTVIIQYNTLETFTLLIISFLFCNSVPTLKLFSAYCHEFDIFNVHFQVVHFLEFVVDTQPFL